MAKRWTWMLVIMIALVAFAGCSDDDDPVTPPADKTAFETMAEAGAAYINGPDCPGVISAADLNADLADYTVIDIRQPQHYGEGHIPGAYNSSLGTLLDDLASKSIPSDKPYVIACYSGQSAGHAKIAMELMYLDATVYSLGFGMASWSYSTVGAWDNAVADNLDNPETDNNNDDLIAGELPTLDGDASTIVATRVSWMLDNGFKGVAYDEIKDNLGDYFIINYFSEDDYLGNGTSGVPGHIPGAYQFTPKSSLAMDQMLNTLPTDGTPIVVYCWTGQHSSQITAYLNMLGYDAYSLKNGSNNLFHTSLTAHQWNDTQKNDFQMEIGAPPTPAFETMADAGIAYVNNSMDCPGVINAVDLNNDLDAYTVIDIRQPQDYADGHIPGAYNSSLGNLMSDLSGGMIPTGKPYVLACYSGQSAGHAKIAMEMMGYSDVYSLLFGMSSWSPETSGSWDNNTSDLLTNPETTNNNDDLVVQVYPALDGDPDTIVDTRVDAMLSAGFKGVAYDDIKDNLGDYFVINYFSEADYLGQGTSGVPGHIPGAFQFTPYASMGMDEMLVNIPADMTVVVYCWTGQHSSQITAYLNMLGYDAYSLKFGSNALFHSSLTAHKWSSAQVNDFAMERGYGPNEAFAAMAAAGANYINNSADCPGVLNAQDLFDNLADFTVIDIRAGTDYEAGHIVGAYNSSLATLIDDMATFPSDKPYVIACYSGQSAGHAKIALELLGYDDVYSLLFGMASWSGRTEMQASWTNNTGNNLTNPDTTPENGNLEWHMFPDLAGNAETVVDDRVAAMLTAGFKGVAYNDIKDNLGDYFVLNYFGEADYLGNGSSGVPGHIPGAYQFTPYSSMGIDQMLGNIPTDMPVVVYCWTGQHSSQVTAYLNMLGYDAYSLKFGSNNLFYDNLTAHKWNVGSTTHDFPLHNDTVAAN